MRLPNISDPTFYLSLSTTSNCLISVLVSRAAIISPRLAVVSLLGGLIFSPLYETTILSLKKDRIIKKIHSYWPTNLAFLIFRSKNVPADDRDLETCYMYVHVIAILFFLSQNGQSKTLQKLIATVIVASNVKFGNLIYRMHHYYRS